MTPEAKFKKNFLRFYLDPELLTEEEAKETLREIGVNVDSIKEKGGRFVKKLEAKISLSKSKEKKEQFLNIVEQFKKENPQTEVSADNNEYKMAARKQNDQNAGNEKGEIDDAKLLGFIRKKRL